MRRDGKIDHLELPGGDLDRVKAFYGTAFGRSFVEYGPRYAAFEEGVDDGFDADAPRAIPLPVFYADDLEAMQGRLEAAGGMIVASIFAFPVGRRFHFPDPAGTELAVWSER